VLMFHTEWVLYETSALCASPAPTRAEGPTK
jgi:hypothetical protein